jgi:primosomal protein N' (replication factor Y)
MKVVHVIPIKKGIPLEQISYFTKEEVDLGMVIEVPFRKKTIFALVVGIEEAADLKSELKASDFALRKLPEGAKANFLSKEFVLSAKETAEYFACSVGATLWAVIPQSLLKDGALNFLNVSKTEEKINANTEQLVLQAEDTERYDHYKSLIREEFARGSSVFICLPTIEDIKKVEQTLNKGITEYTFCFHSGLGKKALSASVEKVMSEPHPVLILATSQFLCLPVKKIGVIIVDREGSRAYKTVSSPFIDMRTFAQIYAKKIKARLLLGDVILRTETIHLLKNDRLVEFSPFKFRIPTTASQIIVDMRKSDERILDNNKENRKKLVTISNELRELISWNKERNENLFIFCVRKGLAPVTVCGDCGSIVKCEICSSPVTLFTTTTKDGTLNNFYKCHTCGKKRDADTLCKTCSSWRLNTQGVGIEKIEEELTQAFRDLKIFRLDTQSVTTHKRALEILEEFYASPGSILIGTEMALLYQNKKVENCAVASIDTLFSLPDFRINERVLNVLLKIRSLAKENFVIQTRAPENKIFDFAVKGNLADFYREEIAERKEYGYPPFFTFIKVTLHGERQKVESVLKALAAEIPYESEVYPAFTPVIEGNFVMHLLIKVPEGKWLDKKVSALLSSLPREFIVKVDPDSIL